MPGEREPAGTRGAAHALRPFRLSRGHLAQYRAHLEEVVPLAARARMEELAVGSEVALGVVRILAGDEVEGRALRDHGLATLNRLDSRFGLAYVAYFAGAAALAGADTSLDPAAALRRSLETCRAGGVLEPATWVLEVVAALLARQGRHRDAAVLWGAAAEARDRTGMRLRWVPFCGVEDAARGSARGALGASFEAALSSGRALSVSQAVALGIEHLRPR